MDPSLKTRVELLFGGRCGRAPQGVVISRGRLVVLGEHVDHQLGHVLTAPLEEGVACAWGVRPDTRGVIWAMNFKGKDSFHHGQQIRTGRGWSDRARGACELVARGDRRLPGIDLMVLGDLPTGEGLASSAAYLVAVLRSLFEAIGEYRSKWELAEDVPNIERDWAGVPCGVMDPYVIAAAPKLGTVMHVDCRELDHEVLALPPECELVAEDTGIQRELKNTPYAERRRELATALAEVQAVRPEVRGLPDLTPEAFAELEDRIREPGRRRARHVVTETDRVRRGADALRTGDVETLGRLMAEGHRSLVEDFESSLPEVDRLVEMALAQPGVLGARLQGAGWGGRIAVLQRRAQREQGEAS